METFDPKPSAPLNVRGPWGAIRTAVPGTLFGEMLPDLARMADKFAPSSQPASHQFAASALADDDGEHAAPRFAWCRSVVFDSRRRTGYAGVCPRRPALSAGAGSLGRSAEPLEVSNPLAVAGSLDEFTLSHDVDPDRLDDRQHLLQNIDGLRRLADGSSSVRSQDAAYRRAMDMLTSTRVRDAFDLSRK